MNKVTYNYNYHPTFGNDAIYIRGVEDDPAYFPPAATSGDDLIIGRNGKADSINAGAGADTIRDGQNDYVSVNGQGNVTSDDVFVGGNGNDKLVHWAGNDVLDGGNGADEFIFRAGMYVNDGNHVEVHFDQDGDTALINNTNDGIEYHRAGNGVDIVGTVQLGGGEEATFRIVGDDGFIPRAAQLDFD